MAARIRPPGEISAYSNYGAALAGYIVTRVSGEPYERYVRRHLFDPLGMTRTSATEPPSPESAAALAKSYDSTTRPPRPIPLIFDRMPPDGSISSTATDMARFMAAHLTSGPILSPAGMARMHQTSYTADPRLGGYAHGFFDRRINGHRVLMHDGSWEGFESAMVLVPACGLGVFLSANATGGIIARVLGVANRYEAFACPLAVLRPGAVDAPARPQSLFVRTSSN